MSLTRLLFVVLVASCAAIAFPDDARGQRRKKKDDPQQMQWPLLMRRDVFAELPSALVRETPFKTEQLYQIPPSKNREQLYNRIWFVLDPPNPRDSIYGWNLGAGELEVLASDRDLMKRIKKTERAMLDLKELRESSEAFSSNGDPGKLEPRELKKGKRILKELQWVVDDFQVAAGERDVCFVHRLKQRNWGFVRDFDSKLDSIVQLWFLVHPDEMDLELMKAMLQYYRDYVPLSKRRSTIEHLALDPFAERYLASCETPDQVDKFVEVIEEHQEKCKSLNPVLESARAMFLERCLRFLLVRDKVYLNEGYSRPSPSHAAASYFPLQTSRSEQNKWVVRHFKYLRELEGADWADFEKEIIDDLEKKTIAGQVNAQAMLLQMKDSDCAREIAIERQRYLEYESAFKLPIKERAEQLDKLNKVWTIDGSWKKSVYRLQDFRPPSIYDSRQSVSEARMAIALAAMVKFRLAHKGKPPKDLKQAFEFARSGPVPVDPFNGKPLQMRISGRKFGVASVGPDGIDDEATGDDGKVRKKRRSDDGFVWIEVDQ